MQCYEHNLRINKEGIPKKIFIMKVRKVPKRKTEIPVGTAD
jgi:hypothetical protein